MEGQKRPFSFSFNNGPVSSIKKLKTSHWEPNEDEDEEETPILKIGHRAAFDALVEDKDVSRKEINHGTKAKNDQASPRTATATTTVTPRTPTTPTTSTRPQKSQQDEEFDLDKLVETEDVRRIWASLANTNSDMLPLLHFAAKQEPPPEEFQLPDVQPEGIPLPDADYVIVEEDSHTLQARSFYIPLRLEANERKLLAILEGALEVSEYTDKVDVLRYQKQAIIRDEIMDLLKTILGLCVAQDFGRGRRAIEGTVNEKHELFADIFEIGRRYKVLNPDKMRTAYGKMVFLLSDATNMDGFRSLNDKPIVTVGEFLQSIGGLELLNFPALVDATFCIKTSNREALDDAAKRRQEARESLRERFTPHILSAEDLERVFDSLTDNSVHLMSYRQPIDRMLEYLRQYFHPHDPRMGDLSISRGIDGSTLSHNHRAQFSFVNQTLQLWREIQNNIFKLWIAAEKDIINEPYQLTNTGQGLNRLQNAPTVGRHLHSILRKVMNEVGESWVGLSVTHLGDRDVPNALVFIDKYSQIPRILNPIVNVLDKLKKLEEDEATNAFLTVMGGRQAITQRILRDFFRHGFDGSGDDGGSCIDGRLTSAWNWCSLIEKKPYYSVFLLAGFQGFDGSFRR
eukprot:TRINITY_DN11468_c0_g1_i1.p1 TRINITY_DN11468_c0_g1~~TRINITY_DN11468_c0_g1_i1.p1  ORF type:complete len:627 (+),score=97.59 TRINITY_DN11468_c0_g1_i1:109-1989(+)